MNDGSLSVRLRSSKFILPPFRWRLLQSKRKKESPMRTILECIQQFRAGREHTSVLAKAPPKKKRRRRRRRIVGVFVGPCRLPSIPVTKNSPTAPVCCRRSSRDAEWLFVLYVVWIGRLGNMIDGPGLIQFGSRTQRAGEKVVAITQLKKEKKKSQGTNHNLSTLS